MKVFSVCHRVAVEWNSPRLAENETSINKFLQVLQFRKRRIGYAFGDLHDQIIPSDNDSGIIKKSTYLSMLLFLSI